MKYLSVCSGIEAISEAWRPLGMEPVLFSEIEQFPASVLKARHGAVDARKSRAAGGVPLWGDFTTLRTRHFERLAIEVPDILVGGTPCQAFSIAGLRNSLSDARGNLTLEFVRLANAIDNLRRHAGNPGLIVTWENVPGVLSANDNAFGCFLAGLVGADAPLQPPRQQGRWTDAGMVTGPKRTAAWRILDAQHFGLAQRRRRVFVVACPGGGGNPAAVLFEHKGMHGNPQKSEGTGERVAALTANGVGTCGADDNRGQAGHLIPHTHRSKEFDASKATADLARCVTAGEGKRQDWETCTIVAVPLQEVGKRTGISTDDPRAGIGIGSSGDPMFTLQAGAQHGVALAFPERMSGTQCASSEDISPSLGATNPTAVAFQVSRGEARERSVAPPLMANGGPHRHGEGSYSTTDFTAIRTSSAVRRLTVIECHRLQGFRDTYLFIPYKRRKIDPDEAAYCHSHNLNVWQEQGQWYTDVPADGPMYKALGNSMAVPCVKWIGARIKKVLGHHYQ